ncbi:MAG: hypothetical protein WDN23_00925 [Edaphobacter sp.]
MVIAERKDVAIMTIICDKCEVEVSVKAETSVIPDACPSCLREYGKNMIEALLAFKRFHSYANTVEEQAGKSVFRLTIKQTE